MNNLAEVTQQESIRGKCVTFDMEGTEGPCSEPLGYYCCSKLLFLRILKHYPASDYIAMIPTSFA